ncbi:F-box/FBD/LRR-repeat protein At1g13570-like [Rutidosis leptorrhynchoides]|uniref:F-box/FBD/LRR-repeat protein At1g13570-like n=1 Tax=Rutidosis leptorrhynchoides TaxID=125765 RepID=UPI003A99B563
MCKKVEVSIIKYWFHEIDYHNMNVRRSFLDRISTLPQPIIDTILCLLPIEDAVRTSILSRDWRYRWTTIPELFFDEVMIGAEQFFDAVNQVLLLHQGPLLKFSLIEDEIRDEIGDELDQIISHLSRMNTVKIFSLVLNKYNEYRLPLSFFSLHQLTNLHLHNVSIYDQPTFDGFGSLSSLYLHGVKISTKTLVHLVSSCPLLKRFTLFIREHDILGNDVSSITDLIECLPVIERLVTSIWVIYSFNVDSLPQELPISLVHLKYLDIDDMCFLDCGGLPLLFLLIRSSPNLEKLKLGFYEGLAYDPRVRDSFKKNPVTLEGYSNIWLKNLNKLKIYGFFGFELHLEFVLLIMAKSPMLKKVTIELTEEVTDDVESIVSRTLLHSPRASGSAKVIVKRETSEIYAF